MSCASAAIAATTSNKPKNPRIIDQTITICGRRGDRRYNDQGLEGSELSLYTNGTCSGVMIRAMSRTMTLATPSTGSLAW